MINVLARLWILVPVTPADTQQQLVEVAVVESLSIDYAVKTYDEQHPSRGWWATGEHMQWVDDDVSRIVLYQLSLSGDAAAAQLIGRSQATSHVPLSAIIDKEEQLLQGWGILWWHVGPGKLVPMCTLSYSVMCCWDSAIVGIFIISYQCRVEVTVVGSMYHYSLHWWLFELHKPLKHVSNYACMGRNVWCLCHHGFMLFSGGSQRSILWSGYIKWALLAGVWA